MLSIALVLGLCGFSAGAVLEDVFSWKQIEFAWPTEEIKQNAIRTGYYIPENNLPLGIGRYQDKLFVTVPRWKAGVGASLNYVPLNPINSTAALIPYPNWQANLLPPPGQSIQPNSIISTFRVHVDLACDRLFVVDTGLADILGSPNQISKPALVVFDLRTDQLIRRYEFKDSDLTDSSFFANVVVDSIPGRCHEAYAYIPDLGGYGIVVYSWATNESWRVKHNYFHFDPLQGDLTVGGVNFQWTDGVFGLALGKPQPNGYRTLYFHPLVSTREFSVCTDILKNRTLATDPHNYHEFKIEGFKGEKTQSTASDFDDRTGVLFLTQLSKDSVACWNTAKPLNPENVGTVAEDREKLIFTNDLKIDAERNLWVLSNRMPKFLFESLDSNDVNYRIFRIPVDEAIQNTPCTN